MRLNVFQVNLLLRDVRRFVYSLFGATPPISYNNSDILFIEAALENMYGVDLHTPQHGHDEVQMKRFFVNYLIESTGWSVTELSRKLDNAGIKAKGLSRRSLQYYVNTHDDTLSDECVGKAVLYGRAYNAFSNNINSIL